jgi:hypothetical protein
MVPAGIGSEPGVIWYFAMLPSDLEDSEPAGQVILLGVPVVERRRVKPYAASLAAVTLFGFPCQPGAEGQDVAAESLADEFGNQPEYYDFHIAVRLDLKLDRPCHFACDARKPQS